jgi:hypothetical protein
VADAGDGVGLQCTTNLARHPDDDLPLIGLTVADQACPPTARLPALFPVSQGYAPAWDELFLLCYSVHPHARTHTHQAVSTSQHRGCSHHTERLHAAEGGGVEPTRCGTAYLAVKPHPASQSVVGNLGADDEVREMKNRNFNKRILSIPFYLQYPIPPFFLRLVCLPCYPAEHHRTVSNNTRSTLYRPPRIRNNAHSRSMPRYPDTVQILEINMTRSNVNHTPPFAFL